MKDIEYFVLAESFAAPFCSETSTRYVTAKSPEMAINTFRDTYKHPAGLYSAACFQSADAREKGYAPLARWVCNLQLEIDRLTKGMSSYSFCNEGGGMVRINDKIHHIENYKGGQFVTV